MTKLKKIATICVCALLGVFMLTATYFIEVRNNISASQTVETGTLSENKAVQSRLKDLGYYTGPIDGYLGGNTVPAIRAFQRDDGLSVDGIVGKQTLQALGVTVGSQQASSDLYLLAKCVYAEARGEPYEGQVAVAAVILNRVEDPAFPNSISGVIYQPWAFTAVHDGQISLEPDAIVSKVAEISSILSAIK